MRPQRARPYAFVLHGLWPQNTRGWPEDCESPDRGFVPKPVARRMLDIMPSERLVFHEYRKHGTCSGLGVDGYFDLARQLHDKVRIPQRFKTLDDSRTFVGVDELVNDFVRANPGLKPDMVAVQCGGPGKSPEGGAHLLRQGRGLPRLRAQREPEATVRSRPHVRAAGSPIGLPPAARPTEGQPESQPRGKGDPDDIAPGPRERRL